MSFATNLQDVANKILTTYGRAVTMTRVTEGSYDTSSSSTGSGTTITYNGVAHPSPYRSEEIDNTIILVNDVKLLVYTLGVPLVGDTTVLDGTTHRVMSVNRLNAQGLNIVYELQLRA